MYDKYWALKESPFKNEVNVEWFQASPIHEEAIARILFLIEQRRRFGLLVSDAGLGKTLLLQVLKKQLEQNHYPAAYVDLFGRDVAEMLFELTGALGLTPVETSTNRDLLRALHDYLRALHLTRQHCIVSFDHLERASEGCLAVLERLIHVDGGVSPSATFIVASRCQTHSDHLRLLQGHSDLRVELSPLTLPETAQYVAGLLERAGCQTQIFGRSAIESIYEMTAGCPRDINRLCELSLLAAMSEGLDRVNAAVVRSAEAELRSRPRSQATAHA